MLANFAGLDPEFEDVFKSPNECGVFRLFDLPPELWIKICRFAVTKPTNIQITRTKQTKHQVELVRQPPITRACRLLRAEALPLFYRANTFEAFHWSKPCIRYWLMALGPANLRHMSTFLFHAKFEPEFWIEKFKDMGIDTHVVKAETPEEAQAILAPRLRFQTLVVKFL